jgi:hypothetical protein
MAGQVVLDPGLWQGAFALGLELAHSVQGMKIERPARRMPHGRPGRDATSADEVLTTVA